jgi:hypothetical protein
MSVKQIRAGSDNHKLGMRSGSKLFVQVTSDQSLTRRKEKNSVSTTVHFNFIVFRFQKDACCCQANLTRVCLSSASFFRFLS